MGCENNEEKAKHAVAKRWVSAVNNRVKRASSINPGAHNRVIASNK